MKTITVVIPTYNEEKNVEAIYSRVKNIFSQQLPNYICNIQFIDNCSKDKTRTVIEKICREDTSTTAIFNVKNFGFNRSLFYGLTQAKGDCAILIFADMQDPPEVIPQFVEQWEKGFKIVTGIRHKSKESFFMSCIRKIFYKIIKNISDIDHINYFDGFGLYDRTFIEIIKNMEDSLPYLRGIVAELGYQRADVLYVQEKREKGKSSFNFLSMYDLAMLGITSYSKVVMHFATIIGAIISALSILVAAFTFILKLLYWETFPFGSAAITIGIFFLGAMQLFFIGFVGEYILNINIRTMRHPLVIEEKRINFIECDEPIISSANNT